MTVLDLSGEILRATDGNLAWSRTYVLGDKAQYANQITQNLQRPFSATGDGKQFASGVSYLGIESTLAWVAASGDPFYPVMRTGIDTFSRRWAGVEGGLEAEPYHYVSLGPGTGQKDVVVLRQLGAGGPARSYFMVDMSDDMMRLAGQHAVSADAVRRECVFALQLDFSQPVYCEQLGQLLGRAVGAEPILYSFLGNTVANFPDDLGCLRAITRLLRPQDRLLLELATTEGISEDLATAAAAEYAGTVPFRQFVTSALLHFTDLTIDLDNVFFMGEVEQRRALVVKAIYRNRTGETIRVTVPGRMRVEFEPRETIRLHMTRKYGRPEIAELLAAAGLERLAIQHTELELMPTSHQFGVELLLLRRGRASGAGALAEALWPRTGGGSQP